MVGFFDGVTEKLKPSEEEFGDPRLQELAQAQAGASTTTPDRPEKTVDTILEFAPLQVIDLETLERIEAMSFASPWPREAFFQAIRQHHVYTLAARVGPTLIAYLISYVNNTSFVIANVAVDVPHRRKGVGSRILQVALDEAAGRGLKQSLLDVRASNLAAIRMYEEHGFRMVGHKLRYYSSPPEDAMTMMRSLEKPHDALGNLTSLSVAMWSGPRNLSTAMMRAWDNRPDTVVCDEPLYLYYLRETGADHPGASEYTRNYEETFPQIVSRLTNPTPGSHRVFFQKHMAQHLIPGMDRGWTSTLRNCFLIREPREMLTSLVRMLPTPQLHETGLPQQRELFEAERERTGRIPPVLDAQDVLGDPRTQLSLLCEQLGVEFLEEMLSWPPGPRATDGIWAKHWYGVVEQSTGFQPYRPKNEDVPEHLKQVYRDCLSDYEALYKFRLGT